MVPNANKFDLKWVAQEDKQKLGKYGANTLAKDNRRRHSMCHQHLEHVAPTLSHRPKCGSPKPLERSTTKISKSELMFNWFALRITFHIISNCCQFQFGLTEAIKNPWETRNINRWADVVDEAEITKKKTVFNNVIFEWLADAGENCEEKGLSNEISGGFIVAS